MRTDGWRSVLLAVGACMLAGTLAAEEEGGMGQNGPRRRPMREGEGPGPREKAMREEAHGPVGAKLREFHRHQAEKRREFSGEQRKAMEAFRDGIRDQEPKTAAGAMIKQHSEQFAARAAFADKQYTELVEFVTKLMEEENAPAEKRQEHLGRIKTRHEELVKRMDEHHAKVMAVLTELSKKEGLTWNDIHAAMKNLFEDREGPGPEGRRRGFGPRREEGLRRGEDDTGGQNR